MRATLERFTHPIPMTNTERYAVITVRSGSSQNPLTMSLKRSERAVFQTLRGAIEGTMHSNQPNGDDPVMKVAYICASAFWQVSVLAGGAFMTYVSGSVWWIAGAVFLTLMAGRSFSLRMDNWNTFIADGEALRSGQQ